MKGDFTVRSGLALSVLVAKKALRKSSPLSTCPVFKKMAKIVNLRHFLSRCPST